VDAITALLNRCSAKRTVDPAPSAEDLDVMLRAAVQAPDHGRLQPWRFITVRGNARLVLGRVFAEALSERDPSASPAALEREAQKLTRAPLVIVVVCHPAENSKVPPIEQVVSAGAAAQNILLAAYQLGYGAMWRTGAHAYDAKVHAALGLDSADTIVGFVYVGTLEGPLPVRAQVDPTPFITEWTAQKYFRPTNGSGTLRP
jgi:nitroreductase